MQIINVLITEIKEYKNNPRANEQAVEVVKNSIEEFGFKVPIVIDKNKTIIAGHTRVKAAKKLGYESVPCIIAKDLSEKQVQAFRVIDNKTSELANWDFVKLEQEIKEIENDFSLETLGFREAETDFINDVINPDDLLLGYDEPKEAVEKIYCPNCGHEGVRAEFKTLKD